LNAQYYALHRVNAYYRVLLLKGGTRLNLKHRARNTCMHHKAWMGEIGGVEGEVEVSEGEACSLRFCEASRAGLINGREGA
jgi:hypothetical protein